MANVAYIAIATIRSVEMVINLRFVWYQNQKINQSDKKIYQRTFSQEIVRERLNG